MLINHITGNRKSLYQLMQACCKPDTGENHATILRTSSDRARPSPSKWALSLWSGKKVSAVPQVAQVHGRPRTPSRRLGSRAVPRALQPDIHSHQEAPTQAQKSMLAREPQAAGGRHIRED